MDYQSDPGRAVSVWVWQRYINNSGGSGYTGKYSGAWQQWQRNHRSHQVDNHHLHEVTGDRVTGRAYPREQLRLQWHIHLLQLI